MVSKNSLASVKVKDEKTLKDIEQVSAIAHEKKSKVGRKKKPAEEKETGIVTLKILQSELENLKKNAGVEPLSTYVKRYLRTETDIFK